MPVAHCPLEFSLTREWERRNFWGVIVLEGEPVGTCGRGAEGGGSGGGRVVNRGAAGRGGRTGDGRFAVAGDGTRVGEEFALVPVVRKLSVDPLRPD